MSRKDEYERKTWALLEPVAAELGLHPVDAEFVKEGQEYFLRICIDKDGGVGIDDCEAVSRAVDPMLDEADPIPDAYTFEVSSAGADRPLKKPEHFAAFLGAEFDVKFYKAVDGQKTRTGILAGYDGGDVTLSLGDREVTYPKSEIAAVRLHVSF